MVKAIQELKVSGELKDKQIAELRERLDRFERVQQLLEGEIERLKSEDGKTLSHARLASNN